jgi:hypothetical protein
MASGAKARFEAALTSGLKPRPPKQSELTLERLKSVYESSKAAPSANVSMQVEIQFPSRLESVAQRELNQPRRAQGAGDFAERSIRQDSVHAIWRADDALITLDIEKRWVAEIDVVPDVEEIRGEPEALTLGDPEILDQ